MFVVITVRKHDHRDRHELFRQDAIQIGRLATNDLVLEDRTIDRHHAMLYIDEGGTFVIEETHTVADDRFNERRTPWSPPEIDGSTIRIKPFTLLLEHFGEAAEVAMLEAVSCGDDATRIVYADWLEQRGDAPRAELLRSQLAIVAHDRASPEFTRLAERMYALAARVPPGWSSLVARPAIDLGSALTFRVGPTRGARRIEGEEHLVVQIWLAGAHLTTRDDIAFVAQFRRSVASDLEIASRLRVLPHPTDDGVENHRRCLAAGTETIRRYAWMDWGPTTDGITALAFRDGDDVVLTASTVDRTEPVAARMPIAELVAQLRDLVALLAS